MHKFFCVCMAIIFIGISVDSYTEETGVRIPHPSDHSFRNLLTSDSASF